MLLRSAAAHDPRIAKCRPASAAAIRPRSFPMGCSVGTTADNSPVAFRVRSCNAKYGGLTAVEATYSEIDIGNSFATLSRVVIVQHGTLESLAEPSQSAAGHGTALALHRNSRPVRCIEVILINSSVKHTVVCFHD